MMTNDSSRQLGIWMTSAIVVGSMIGSGIFLLPVSLAPLGVNSLVGWLVSGVGALAIAFSLARISTGGAGIQAAIEARFGEFVAFVVTFSFWCSGWTSVAALGVATASALSWLDPRLQTGAFIVPVAIVSVLILAAVNSRGVRAAGSLSVVTVGIRVVPLLAVIVIAALRATADRTSGEISSMPLNAAGLGSAVALTLFAMTGFENATAPVEKVKDPASTLPRALIGGVIFVALLYLLSSSAVVLVLNEQQITTSASPFADAIASEWGNGAAALAAGGIAVAAFGSLNSNLLASGELAYSMSLRGELPALFASTRGARTPVAAHWLSSVLAILLILANVSRTTAGLFTFIILLVTAATLVLYFIGSLAAWKLATRIRERIMVIAALAFSLFALWGAGLEADAWELVLLAIGVVIRFAVRRFSSRDGSTPAVEASPAVPPV